MNIRTNNNYRNNNVCFGSNKGVLKAVELIKKDNSLKNIRELQAQAKTAELTPDFLSEIDKITPEDLKNLAKKALGLLPWK